MFRYPKVIPELKNAFFRSTFSFPFAAKMRKRKYTPTHRMGFSYLKSLDYPVIRFWLQIENKRVE